tara:strand:+ start:247 stop:1713 length:1467 start_codon:yes stop_codon:yes gene_type:complete
MFFFKIKKISFYVIFSIFTLFISNNLYAHGTVTKVETTFPLWIYILGGAITVLLSFLIIGSYGRNIPGLVDYQKKHINIDLENKFIVKILVSLIKTFTIFLYLLIIISGFIGNYDEIYSLSSILFWVVFWAGFSILCSIFGNFWFYINPLKVLFDFFEKLLGFRGRQNYTYPKYFDYWPAVVLFLVFAIFELIFEGSDKPRNISLFVIFYSIFIWLGMYIYGGKTWLQKSDIFTIIFELFSKLSFIEKSSKIKEQGPRDLFDKKALSNYKYFIRYPSSGLLLNSKLSPSLVIFIILVLSTVTFDGISMTDTWLEFIYEFSDNAYVSYFVQLIALNLLFLSFVLIFFSFCKLIKIFGKLKMSVVEIASIFVITLLPIAVAYHLSHYLWYFIVTGQETIALISDPFGYGWNLFRTSDFKVNRDFNLELAHSISVGLIILGHIGSVFTSHVYAVRLSKNEKDANYSQYPFLILMIGYTILSLWIVSQSLTI